MHRKPKFSTFYRLLQATSDKMMRLPSHFQSLPVMRHDLQQRDCRHLRVTGL